jgi:hypothetical protein
MAETRSGPGQSLEPDRRSRTRADKPRPHCDICRPPVCRGFTMTSDSGSIFDDRGGIMSVTTVLCIGKICVSVASILGAITSDNPLEHLKEIFEAISSGVEAASKLQGPEVPTLRRALEASKATVQKAYEQSLSKTHSAGFSETVEIAFASLTEVFDRCIPRGEELSKLRHDPYKIAETMADRAVAQNMEVFSEGEGRKLLVALIVLAYTSLDSKPEFMVALQRVNWKEAFEQRTHTTKAA